MGLKLKIKRTPAAPQPVAPPPPLLPVQPAPCLPLAHPENSGQNSGASNLTPPSAASAAKPKKIKLKRPRAENNANEQRAPPMPAPPVPRPTPTVPRTTLPLQKATLPQRAVPPSIPTSVPSAKRPKIKVKLAKAPSIVAPPPPSPAAPTLPAPPSNPVRKLKFKVLTQAKLPGNVKAPGGLTAANTLSTVETLINAQNMISSRTSHPPAPSRPIVPAVPASVQSSTTRKRSITDTPARQTGKPIKQMSAISKSPGVLKIKRPKLLSKPNAGTQLGLPGADVAAASKAVPGTQRLKLTRPPQTLKVRKKVDITPVRAEPELPVKPDSDASKPAASAVAAKQPAAAQGAADVASLPEEAQALPEGTAFWTSLGEPVSEADVVPERKLIELINKVVRKDKKNFFRNEPQSVGSQLPNKTKQHYRRVIKHPIALLSIKEYIRSSHQESKIRTYEQLKLAFNLMVANCVCFNGAQNEFTTAAEALLAECCRVIELQKASTLQMQACLQAQGSLTPGLESGQLSLRSRSNVEAGLPRRAAAVAAMEEARETSTRGRPKATRTAARTTTNMRIHTAGLKRVIVPNARQSFYRSSPALQTWGMLVWGKSGETTRTWSRDRPKLGHGYPKKYIPMNSCALKVSFHIHQVLGSIRKTLVDRAAKTIVCPRVKAAAAECAAVAAGGQPRTAPTTGVAHGGVVAAQPQSLQSQLMRQQQLVAQQQHQASLKAQQQRVQQQQQQHHQQQHHQQQHHQQQHHQQQQHLQQQQQQLQQQRVQQQHLAQQYAARPQVHQQAQPQAYQQPQVHQQAQPRSHQLAQPQLRQQAQPQVHQQIQPQLHQQAQPQVQQQTQSRSHQMAQPQVHQQAQPQLQQQGQNQVHQQAQPQMHHQAQPRAHQQMQAQVHQQGQAQHQPNGQQKQHLVQQQQQVSQAHVQQQQLSQTHAQHQQVSQAHAQQQQVAQAHAQQQQAQHLW